MSDRSSVTLWSFGAAVAPAVVWVLLATRTPTSTHHFAPLVVAVAPLVFVTTRTRREIDVASLIGAAVGLTIIAALAGADRLRGPTLLETRPSWPELVVFVIVGSAGARSWRRRQAGDDDVGGRTSADAADQ